VYAVGNGLKQDERVVLAVRPEVVTMEIGSIERENALVGNIEKITFEGTFMRYEIRLSSQDSVVVNRPSLTEEWIEVGKTVTLSFPPEKTHVFAYPASGLTEEIAV